MKIKVRKIHELKTWPRFFQDMADGVKTFELRKDDRGFEIGDALLLREYMPDVEQYTGRQLIRLVVYKLNNSIFSGGLQPDHCILGLSMLPDGVTISDTAHDKN